MECLLETKIAELKKMSLAPKEEFNTSKNHIKGHVAEDLAELRQAIADLKEHYCKEVTFYAPNYAKRNHDHIENAINCLQVFYDNLEKCGAGLASVAALGF